MIEPQLIADYACIVGEGPLWHAAEQRLYWVDIVQGRLFRYHPATGAHEMCFEGDQLGGFTIQADGALLLFMARGTIKIWRDGVFTTVIDEIPEERETRFNDVFADPAGRVFCGTMPTADRPGRLYRLDLRWHAHQAAGWDRLLERHGPDARPRAAVLHRLQAHARSICSTTMRPAARSATSAYSRHRAGEGEGIPDGMTVDAQGYIWSARWDGGCLVRYTPDGVLERRISFPAKKVSSVTFGGPDYTDMYVTTAGGDHKAEQGAGAGALFRLNLGIQGVPEFQSRVGL